LTLDGASPALDSAWLDECRVVTLRIPLASYRLAVDEVVERVLARGERDSIVLAPAESDLDEAFDYTTRSGLGKNLSLSFGRQLHELSPIRSLGIQWIRPTVVFASPISIRCDLPDQRIARQSYRSGPTCVNTQTGATSVA